MICELLSLLQPILPLQEKHPFLTLLNQLFTDAFFEH